MMSGADENVSLVSSDSVSSTNDCILPEGEPLMNSGESYDISSRSPGSIRKTKKKKMRQRCSLKAFIAVAVLVVLVAGAAATAALLVVEGLPHKGEDMPWGELIDCSGSNSLPWWKTTIIYQCYPRSFQDSDGDGNGDLNGIRSRLDYFVEARIRAVWLNPIYSSPQKDNGYDISNYANIDPLYGTLADFKTLLKEMHKRELNVIMDFVPNHSSDEHPWFQESRSSRDNSKRDWYVWADGKDGGPPNNWISVFGGSAWSYDNTTEQYYLHQFSDFQPDLNYRNQHVKGAMEEVLKFWVDLGVDGFRVDAVIFLLEDPKLENERRNPQFTGNCTANISSPDCYNSLIHNLTTNYDRIHDIIRSWRKVLDSYSDKTEQERFMVGEVYDPISEVITYYGNKSDEFNFPFNFLLLGNSNWTGTQVSSLVAEWLDNIPEGAWSNWVLGNHDNPRISSKAGVYLSRALNVLLLTLPGTPTTYYGEEIMMTDVYVPPPERHDKYQDRDKERTPMQWNTSAYAGFTSPDSKPWLPVATNYSTYNVEVESRDSRSPLTLYKKLSELRSNYSALQYAGYEHVYNSTDLFAYLRFCQDRNKRKQVLVVINFSKHQTTAKLIIDLKDPTIVLSSNLNRTGTIQLSNVKLLGEEALIIVAGS